MTPELKRAVLESGSTTASRQTKGTVGMVMFTQLRLHCSFTCGRFTRFSPEIAKVADLQLTDRICSTSKAQAVALVLLLLRIYSLIVEAGLRLTCVTSPVVLSAGVSD